jgi:hypothetical protein
MPAQQDVEAEGGVGGEQLGVHASEYRNLAVDVVVELDVVLAAVGAQEGGRRTERPGP